MLVSASLIDGIRRFELRAFTETDRCTLVSQLKQKQNLSRRSPKLAKSNFHLMEIKLSAGLLKANEG